MSQSFALRASFCAIAAAIAGLAAADETATALDAVVVTAPPMTEPLTVVNDPKAPQQPVPANDGAAFLKNISGFTQIRKGGTDGDPVLRGLAGSRLNVLLDGAEFHGGCGMRMDPPTAYVFPETFDKVTVIKGPQTVLHGNGNIAGVVLFEHDPARRPRLGTDASVSLLGGAWGRLDAIVDGGYTGDKASFRATLSHASSDDYEDGDGNSVHSTYERKNLSAVAAWTPDRNTRLELSAVASEAEAAYADRSMDGIKFDRQGYGLKFEKLALSPVVQKLSAQVNHNDIDHVMDNYSQRDLVGMAMVNNPDRETQSARVAADLALGTRDLLTLGVSWRDDEHTLRKASGMAAYTYESLPRIRDMETDITGLFGELRHELADGRRVIAGLRLDQWNADRFNAMTGAALADADESLKSGFVRYEQDLAGQGGTAFIGLGHAERPMDYWEAATYNGLTAAGALKPEKSTQLDTGVIWKQGAVDASVSLFYNRIDDYLQTRATGACTTPGNCTVANIDAVRWGAEADAAWRFAPAWTARGSLAWVRADNETRDVPLAQTPPLEARLGLDYKTGAWRFGGVLRMVAKQDRIDVGYGNIVGQDYGETAGFATLALNMAYRPSQPWLITAGIDNVFDKTYAEHLARDNTFEAGSNTRVNEPGRFVWAKVNYRFD
ncbi:MAG: TonB-dependent copper receptor [Pseudomonadota bacterium]